MLFTILLLLAGCCSLPAKKAGPAQPVAVSWSDLPGWKREDHLPAFRSFLSECHVLKGNWGGVCRNASQLSDPDAESARRFFEENFRPFRLVNTDGSDEGLITGYYEPVIQASLHPSAIYRHPVYGTPKDLVTVDLSSVYPQLAHLNLKGRVVGSRLVPYYSRSVIEGPASPLAGDEILWTDDLMALFFLQVQGSGKARLDDGNTVRLAYGDQNGLPYQSIGRVLVKEGELDVQSATMQGILDWGRRNPGKVRSLLERNPSYVFFRMLPDSGEGPTGSLGVPLSAGRSLAVDSRAIPLGAPVYLSTELPDSRPFERLMLAQDTGGAIRGQVRADIYWGTGSAAGEIAGTTRQRGRMWILLPAR